MAEEEGKLRELVAEVAAAYFSNSHVSPSEIPNVISQIAGSLGGVGQAPEAPAVEEAAAAPETKKLTSAQVRKSITPEALISFEDSKAYKTLKRHLSTRGLTPAQYREKWGLPKDYPMVAPSYSEQRSQLAKTLGLGRKAAQPARRRGGGRRKAETA
jgi:predicted transcriptional regulator